MRIAYRYHFFVPGYFFCGKNKLIPIGKHNFAVFKSLDSVFRSFGIKHNCNRQVQLSSYFFYYIYLTFMVSMCIMRKIKPCNIHSRFTKFRYYFLCITCRTQRAYYFGFAHFSFSSYLCIVIIILLFFFFIKKKM